jgi:thiamine-phosphate pyrophosphorylase
MQASQWGVEYLGMIFSRLYAIVDAEVLRVRGVGLREFAEGLRAAGVGLVQWRDKVGSPQEVLAGAAILREVFAGSGCRLIMNDRADLAVLAGFGGVHVGQGDLSPEDARRVVGAVRAEAVQQKATHLSQGREGWATQIIGEGTRIGGRAEFRVGVSTHTEEQVRVADAGCADYVAIGPVFATGTKADAEAVVGLEGVRRARALTGKPIVAIGGITRENARSVIEAGADSVAVISGLFGVGETVEKVAGDFLRIFG